jgi:hypothetical protein
MKKAPEPSLQLRLNRITSKYALYFSLEGSSRSTDSSAFIALLSDLSLIVFAQEVLRIIGSHMVERATDFVIDKTAGALKRRLLSGIHAKKADPSEEMATQELDTIQLESSEIERLLLEALRQAKGNEQGEAIAAGQAEVTKFVKTEFKLSDEMAQKFAIAVTNEIRVTVSRS